MNILVTGSNGFIGSHVADYLKSQGHYIIGLGRKPQCAIDSFINEYICCDLSSSDITKIPQMVSVHIDAVIHLAADMRKEPYCAEVLSANCCGTQRLLEMCEKDGIGVFLQLSSLPVIGHPIEHPITENHPIHPYTVYHITKFTEELLANYAFEYHGVRTASFRISAPIGPRMNPLTIFPSFVRKALVGEDLVLLGNGTRKQNYVYVKDIARCLELSLANHDVHGVYNLTSDMLLSNYDLAKIIIDTLNSRSQIVFNGIDPTDHYVWDASLERIKFDAGYSPSAVMEEIVLEYSSWLQFQ